MTEFSGEADVDGKRIHFPLVTPNQSFKDLSNVLTGGRPTGDMYDKAIEHAQSRILTGRSPFATSGEQRGFQVLNFADGGMVEDPNKKRPLATSPANTYPGNQAERAGNIYAQSNADLARGFGDAFAGTITGTRGAGQAVQDAYRTGGVGAAIGQGVSGSMVPAVGFLDDVARSAERTLDVPAQALKTLATGDASPIGQAQAVGAPVAQTPAATTKAGQTAMPPNSGPVPYTVTPVENTNGVQRINQKGQSPLFTNIDPGQAVAEMKGNPVGGFQPAAGGVGGPDVLGILQRESQIRAGMGELQDRINFNGGNGIGFRKTGTDEAIRDMLVKGNSRDRASALGFALRQQEMQGRQGIANEELGLKREAQGFQTRAQARQEALQARYEAAKTPEERSAIAQQMRDLGGKEFPNRFTVVPGGQEWDANAGAMRNVPGRVINNQTGLDVERPTQGAGQQPVANHIAALKKNPEQAAMFDSVYGKGAAARYLGAGNGS